MCNLSTNQTVCTMWVVDRRTAISPSIKLVFAGVGQSMPRAAKLINGIYSVQLVDRESPVYTQYS